MATYKVVWNRPYSKDPRPLETIIVEATSVREAAVRTAQSVPDPIWCQLIAVINWDTRHIEWQLGDNTEALLDVQ
jgi:hypothetical protein